MKPSELVQIRQQNPFQPGMTEFFGGQGGYPYPYPGIDNPFIGGGNFNLPVPYPPQTPAAGGGTGGGGTGGGGTGGGPSFNIDQVKGFVDRMGGIDGIVGTMTRVQKMVTSFRQMAPMIKLLLGSFGGGKAAAKSLRSNPAKLRRKRRSKKNRPLNKNRTASIKSRTSKGRNRR